MATYISQTKGPCGQDELVSISVLGADLRLEFGGKTIASLSAVL